MNFVSIPADYDLLVEFGVDDPDPRVRRVAAAFAFTLVGSIAGARFNGAGFSWADAEGHEIDEASLDQHPVHIVVTSMGIDNPSPDVLAAVATGLTGTLHHAASTAGLTAKVSVTPAGAEA